VPQALLFENLEKKLATENGLAETITGISNGISICFGFAARWGGKGKEGEFVCPMTERSDRPMEDH
jgi:hypothetical protein